MEGKCYLREFKPTQGFYFNVLPIHFRIETIRFECYSDNIFTHASPKTAFKELLLKKGYQYI